MLQLKKDIDLGTDDDVKEDEDVLVGPVKGENADAGVQIDDEHKETIGIIYMRIILIYWYVPLVTKRDLVTNIGFHIMKVEIGRDGELIPQDKSG